MAVSRAEEFFSHDILEFLLSPTALELESGTAEQPVLRNQPTIPQQGEPTAFVSVTDADIEKLKDKNTNRNTARTTNTWARRFQKWQEDRGLCIQPSSQLEPAELDKILQRYFAEIRKEDGSEYEPGSLRTMLSSLDRYFKEGGYKHSIIKDKEFESSRKVLNGYAIGLRERGKGKRKMRADPLSEEDEARLWEAGVLGDSNPTSLNHTVFYLISQHFGTRGCQEHHQLQVEHLKIVKKGDGSETEYIEWTEGLTKTRQGGLTKRYRHLAQRVFATGGHHCAVRYLEKLLSKRPPSLRHSGPLYLRPLAKSTPVEAVWFSSQPVGVNSINSFMSTMAKQAGLNTSNKRFTNHSVRKTTVRKLQKAGLPPSKITAITGHKSHQNLDDYTDMDLDEHRNTTSVLSKKPFKDSTNLAIYNPQEPSTSGTEVPHQMQAQEPSSHWPLSTIPFQPMPVYNFSQCNVSFNSTSSSSFCAQKKMISGYKKKRPIIESDSDSD